MTIQRWPPMLGVVGFDGGVRPAVSLAIPPPETPPQEDSGGQCATPTLVCDSISAHKGKCGVLGFVESNPPHYYLTRVTTNDLSNTSAEDSECTGNFHPVIPDIHQDGHSDSSLTIHCELAEQYSRPCCTFASAFSGTYSGTTNASGHSCNYPGGPPIPFSNTHSTECTNDGSGWVGGMGVDCTVAYCPICDPSAPGYTISTTETEVHIHCGESTSFSFTYPCVVGGEFDCCTVACPEGGVFGTGSRSISSSASTDVVQTLSDEYTTQNLIDDTVDALPSYSGCWNCRDTHGELCPLTCTDCTDGGGGPCNPCPPHSGCDCVDDNGDPCSPCGPCGTAGEQTRGCECVAIRDLSDEENLYRIQRFKYKFTFPAPLQQSCTICWVERTVYDNGDPDTDTKHSELVPAGSTESMVHQAFEPSTNGNVRVVITACP